jgi:hypothetical protein
MLFLQLKNHLKMDSCIDTLYSYPSILHCNAYCFNIMKFSYLLWIAGLLTLNVHVMGLGFPLLGDDDDLVFQFYDDKDFYAAPKKNTTQPLAQNPTEPETEEPKPPALTPESLPR